VGHVFAGAKQSARKRRKKIPMGNRIRQQLIYNRQAQLWAVNRHNADDIDFPRPDRLSDV